MAYVIYTPTQEYTCDLELLQRRLDVAHEALSAILSYVGLLILRLRDDVLER